MDIVNHFTTILTTRLVLRPIIADDARSIMDMRSDITTMQYIDRPVMQNISEAESLIANVLELCKSKLAWFWVIEIKETGQVIGSITLWNYQLKHRRAELGYMIDKKFCRKGFMKESAEKVCEFAFKTIGLNSLEAHTRPENLGSQKTLETTGFILDGTLRENAYFKDRFWDTMIYTKLCLD